MIRRGSGRTTPKLNNGWRSTVARTYQLNSRPRLLLSLTDVDEVPANGTVTLTVTSPAGTVTTPTVVNDSTGEYHADFDVAVEGLWTYVWRSTGAVIAAREGSLYVGTTTSIVSLDDAKAHLNITTDDDDDELDLFLDAATAWVEDRVGPVVVQTVTEDVTPKSGLLFLRGPVLSLTTMTDTYGYGYTYDVAEFFPESNGIVSPLAYVTYPTYPVTVTYVAGRTIVPPGVRLACLMYLKALWETQRGATDLPIQGFSDEVDAGDGMGLAIWRAEKLLEPYLLPPAIA